MLMRSVSELLASDRVCVCAQFECVYVGVHVSMNRGVFSIQSIENLHLISMVAALNIYVSRIGRVWPVLKCASICAICAMHISNNLFLLVC